MCCSIYLAIACSFLMGTGDSFLATAVRADRTCLQLTCIQQYALFGDVFRTDSMAAFAVLKAYQVTPSCVDVR